MKQHPDIRVLGTGDPCQLPPIENCNNIKDYVSYNYITMMEMFKQYIELKEIKRLCDPKQQELIKTLHQMLFIVKRPMKEIREWMTKNFQDI